MKKIGFLIILPIFIVASLVIGNVLFHELKPPQKVHFHSGFYVFENNQKEDFSAIRYMALIPCKLHEDENLTGKELQLEKVHLHDNIGNIAHVHRTGATWHDLFFNLKYPIDYWKSTGYINGKRIENWQKKQIRPYDSLLVFVGKSDIQAHLKEQVSKQEIVTREKRSLDCGT